MSRAPEVDLAAPWLDESTLDLLRVVAEGLTSVVGFGLATIGIIDGEESVVAAVTGSGWAVDEEGGRHRYEELVGTRWPLAVVENDLAVTEDWGTFRFLPGNRVDPRQVWRWVPDVDHGDTPDAWRAQDLLLAPIRDADGALRAVISLDNPEDGRRPGPAKRRLMNKYADQAVAAVRTALDRGELAERVRVLEAARAAIRSASSNLDLRLLLEETGQALRTGFDADGLWIHTLGTDRDDVAVTRLEEMAPGVRPRLVELMEQNAAQLWKEQRVNVETREAIASDLEYGDLTDDLLRFCDTHGISSILFVPLGAGSTCVGALAITRGPAREPWSEAETEVAMGLGHDLGRAIDNARSYGRERRLAEELQELQSYKAGMIATLSDKLVAPIERMLESVHGLTGNVGLGEEPSFELTILHRNTHRMQRLVTDLTLLAQVGDPRLPLERRAVDLTGLVVDVVDQHAAQADGLTLAVVHGGAPVLVAGDRAELERAVGNLVGNAVKYTPEGGRVTATLTTVATGEVVVEVADTGVGIREEELPRVFEEFFRSSHPRVRAKPGTGLGLAIVARIVKRHSGRITVESTLGEGSTFRIALPAWKSE